MTVVDAAGRACRIDVIGGEAFANTLVGDSVEALDLTVHTQLLARTGSGVHFGAHVAQLPVSKVMAIVAAMQAAIAAGNSFNVTLADSAGVDDINVSCVPDFAALSGSFYKRGGMSAGYMKDVIFQFIAVGANS